MIIPEIRVDSQTPGTTLTVKECKDWGKIPSDADDQIVQELMDSCRELQEQWTGVSYIQKTLTAHWDKFNDYSVELPFGPVRSITSVKRVYEDGTLSAALTETTDYYISGMDFKKINLYKRWQSAGQIVTGLRVQYVVGYYTPGSGSYPEIPEPLRKAWVRHVATDYYQRDDLEVYQPALYDWVKEIISPYKRANLWL